jgi:hypothetical protein
MIEYKIDKRTDLTNILNRSLKLLEFVNKILILFSGRQQSRVRGQEDCQVGRRA